MYSFQAGGTMRQDFWYWENGTGDRWGPTDVQVGLATAQGYGENPDRERFVSGMLRFHGPESSLTTLYGRWSRTGSTVAITWSSGDREQWRLTWRDDLLWKLELVAATYLVGPLFLDPSLRRDWTAANVGWGFGGATDGFTAGRPLSDCKKRYRGLNSRWNAWRTAESEVREPVARDELHVPEFLTTSTSTERLMGYDPCAAVPAGWVIRRRSATGRR